MHRVQVRAASAASPAAAAAYFHQDRAGLEEQVRHLEKLVKAQESTAVEQTHLIAKAAKRDEVLAVANAALRSKLVLMDGLSALTAQTQGEAVQLKHELTQADSALETLHATLSQRGEQRDAFRDAAQQAQARCAGLAEALEREGREQKRLASDNARLGRDAQTAARNAADAEKRLAKTLSLAEHQQRRISDLEDAVEVARGDAADAGMHAAAQDRKCADLEKQCVSARQREWRHREVEADAQTAKLDVARMLRLLEKTKEYADWGAHWRAGGDTGVDFDDAGGSAYVGPAADEVVPVEDEMRRWKQAEDRARSTPARRSSAAGPMSVSELDSAPAARDEWARYRGLDGGDPVGSPRDEEDLWAPRSAVRAARELHAVYVPHVPFSVLRGFLHRTNAAWRRRERKHALRLHAAFQKRVDELGRRTQHGMPYDKVVQARELVRVKAALQRKRSASLKGRPAQSVARSFPQMPATWYDDLGHAARDDLLTATLNAVESLTIGSNFAQSSARVATSTARVATSTSVATSSARASRRASRTPADGARGR